MKKLFFGIMLAVLITGLSGAALAAEKSYMPTFDVKLNGVSFESEYRQFPFMVYNDITYVPMTYYDCRHLGLDTIWDSVTRTLYINKCDVICVYRDYGCDWKNGDTFAPEICSLNVVVNGKTIDNSAEEYPLLTYMGITYFPLTWRFAVEEFGWEYSFTEEDGLVINSDNYKTHIIDLVNVSGTVAFDQDYYYYNGRVGEDNFIYKAPYYDLNDALIMHQLPRTNLSISAAFINSHDGVYVSYTAGTSPIMSSQYFYKINGRLGILSNEYPDSCRYGNHGRSDIIVRNRDISVKAVNEYFDAATKITYEKNGEIFEVPQVPGRVQIGAYRDGKSANISMDKCIKIYGDKIYFTAFDYQEKEYESDLYVIDTNTGEVKKLIDGVCGFHVYNGWSNEHNADSTMILYDSDGVTMRYTEIDGETRIADNSSYETQGLILKNAVGDYQIYAVYQAIDGSKTVVKTFDGYASGAGSINGVIFETETGTSSFVSDGKLIVYTIGESINDNIRLMVVGDGVYFKSNDSVKGVFARDNSVVYTIGDGRVIRVNFDE